MIDPGQLRTRLVCEEKVPDGTYDAHGNPGEPWTPRFEFWARVRPLKGSDGFDAAQAAGTRAFEVVCRHRPGFKVGCRLRFKLEPGRTMRVASIIDWEERRRELTLTATEEVEA